MRADRLIPILIICACVVALANAAIRAVDFDYCKIPPIPCDTDSDCEAKNPWLVNCPD